MINITDRVETDFKVRVSKIKRDYESGEYPLLGFIFNMDGQACYELFGVLNKGLDDLEYIHSFIINGLYDDGNLGVVPTKQNGVLQIGYVDYNFNKPLYIEDVELLVKSKQHVVDLQSKIKGSDYRVTQTDKWEAYRTASGKFKDLLESYGGSYEQQES